MGLLADNNEIGKLGIKPLPLRQQREETVNRWEKLGLLEGLAGNVKENIANLFECCPSQQIEIDEDLVKDLQQIVNELNNTEIINKEEN